MNKGEFTIKMTMITGSPVRYGLVKTILQDPIRNSDLELIKTYFTNGDEINLDGFTRSNEGCYVKIESPAHDIGYLFFPGLPSSGNYKKGMEAELIIQRNQGLVIDREFTDYQKGLSGFSWRKNQR